MAVGLAPSLPQLQLAGELSQFNASIEAKEEIILIYGSWFTKIVGVDRICRLPVMSAKDLNLQTGPIHPYCKVIPSMLGENSAVRGMTGTNQPFLALKIEFVHHTTLAKHTMVELILKWPSIENVSESHEDTYVTAFFNLTDSGEKFVSQLWRGRSIAVEQLESVKDLLDGKQINGFLGKFYLAGKV